jgi:molybdenum cofactor cytidylyltransferase
MENVAVLVLAAGKSSRMQTPKQLLKIGNQTLLEIVLEKAISISSHTVFCVLGANALMIQQKTSSKNVVFIINENYQEGLSSSIVSGINYLEENHPAIEAILILLADQPAIEVAYLENLFQVYSENKSKIIASNYAEKSGVPAIFPREYFNELKLLQGDFGAREFLQKNKKQTLGCNIQTSLIDLDTKTDFENYKNQLKRKTIP